MNLNLNDEQAALLARELTNLFHADRFFLSRRVQMLREIRNMIRRQPPRAPLPPPRTFAPPQHGRYARRR
jgi:hypothetical protein